MAEQVRRQVVPLLRALLSADIDEQHTTPLSVIRDALPIMTALLHRVGVSPAIRDDQQRRQFPDDDYDLAPASFADIDVSLGGPALEWGAAKAFVHKQRHGNERRA